MPNDAPTHDSEETAAELARTIATMPPGRWRTATLRLLAAIGSDLASIRLGLPPTLVERLTR